MNNTFSQTEFRRIRNNINYFILRLFDVDSVIEDYWSVTRRWENETRSAAKKGLKTFSADDLLAMPGIFANWPREFRRSVGYQYHDLIITCLYDGELCDHSSFRLYEHSEFHNCYTFEVSNSSYVRSGPEYGLTLLLYIG